MKKRELVLMSCLLLALYIIFSVSYVYAQNTTSSNTTAVNLTGFEKSYQCLQEQIDAKGYSAMTVEELAFSLMALGYDKTRQDALKTEIESRKSSTVSCWPSQACTLKDTALVLLSYDHINADTTGIENWLLNQTKSTEELVWYLQIDTNEKATCKITYDNSSKTITVNEDKKLSGSPGTCFTIAHDGYWLEVKSSCYDKEFEISCDKDFLTSTLYRKRTETNKFYISATTNIASPEVKVTEKIQSLCFKQGNTCNYEGSLWAALALQKKTKDIKPFLPYLITLTSDNKRLMPFAFLYSLTSFDEYFVELTGEQKKEGYWQLSDASRRYYDTALAIYTLSGKASGQIDSTVQYLLMPNVQGNGCWGNSVRDTAFILYAASPKPAAAQAGLTPRAQCTDYPEYSCTSATECENLNGSVLSNFNCWGGEICCSKKVVKKSCSEAGGKICLSSQRCSSGGFENVLESYCCIGECQEIEEVEDTCTLAGYACKLECSDKEEEKTAYTCPEGVCCAPKEEKPNYWWIWVLIVLIILLVLAIIFRNRLGMWWFRIRSKFKKTPPGAAGAARPIVSPLPTRGVPGAPGVMQRTGMPSMPLRPVPPGVAPRYIKPVAKTAKDRELEETLKKLREISK